MNKWDIPLTEPVVLTVEEIRTAYKRGIDPYREDGYVTQRIAGESFDAWLQEERAKVWDEAMSAVTRSGSVPLSSVISLVENNRYRAETD